MKFFRVVMNPTIRNCWFPGEPITIDRKEVDAREFIQGKVFHGPTPFRVPLDKNGKAVQFILAAFDMPIISQRVGELLTDMSSGEIQRFPIIIEPSIHGYEILNVTSTIDCLDENISEIMKWTPEDCRPDQVGKYRMVTNITIDPSRTDNKHLFRVRGWEIALIVSEKIVRALESFSDLAIVFQPVC